MACLTLFVVLATVHLVRRSTRPTAADLAWLGAVGVVAGGWAWHLRQIPEEAVHLLEYGVLCWLIYRSLRPSQPNVAVLVSAVLLTTIISPLVQLTGLFYVLLPLKLDRLPPAVWRVFRWVRKLQPWSMLEVFMLGILVALVKLAKMADIVPGISLFCFLGLIYVLAAISAALDPHSVWEKWWDRR